MHRAVAPSSDFPTDFAEARAAWGAINLGSSILGAAGTLWTSANPVKWDDYHGFGLARWEMGPPGLERRCYSRFSGSEVPTGVPTVRARRDCRRSSRQRMRNTRVSISDRGVWPRANGCWSAQTSVERSSAYFIADGGIVFLTEADAPEQGTTTKTLGVLGAREAGPRDAQNAAD